MNGGPFPELDEASMAQLQTAMAGGRLTAQALIEMFLARIEALDQNGPQLHAILEINPHHPIIVKISNESDDEKFADWSAILFDQSVLTLGEQLEDPISFVNRLNALLSQM